LPSVHSTSRSRSSPGRKSRHIGALYALGLSEVLGVQPASVELWLELLALLLLAMEAHKRLHT
jgi:hypothetical protein